MGWVQSSLEGFPSCQEVGAGVAHHGTCSIPDIGTGQLVQPIPPRSPVAGDFRKGQFEFSLRLQMRRKGENSMQRARERNTRSNLQMGCLSNHPSSGSNRCSIRTRATAESQEGPPAPDLGFPVGPPTPWTGPRDVFLGCWARRGGRGEAGEGRQAKLQQPLPRGTHTGVRGRVHPSGAQLSFTWD